MRAVHLDLVRGLKAIQLVQKLEHGALHFAVPASTAVVHSRGADAVHLVHEDDAWSVFPRHHKELSNLQADGY
jgi:hypothetical protein